MRNFERHILNKSFTTVCPLCGMAVDRLIHGFENSPEARLLKKIEDLHPEWHLAHGACSRCIDRSYVKIMQSEMPGEAVSEATYDPLVLPTPDRLNASREYLGNGTTICVIDSGFYPHPDLIQPLNRIRALVDITHPGRRTSYFNRAYGHSWHGTMTAVVAAGNGFRSNGVYSSIAPEADLVLIKVQDDGRITGENIAKAIRWAIRYREQHNIRIINLSVTDDWAISYQDSVVSQAAEAAVEAGITVVAAIGNDTTMPIRPPASAPNVIAVGGLNDQNTMWMGDDTLYHSTFGYTVDDFLKPGIIAPSIWLAAPILPKTDQQREAHALFDILEANDNDIRAVLAREIEHTGLSSSLLHASPGEIRDAVAREIYQNKYIHRDYQHADGTSFAAPIVCSVIAQMLEASPALTPRAIRNILFLTARPLKNVSIERQGHGVIDPPAAVDMALKENHPFLNRPPSPFIDRTLSKIVFYFHNHDVRSVSLAGSFNGWEPNQIFFDYYGEGRWRLEIPMLPNGFYLYKFVLDGWRWIDDPENVFREPDGFNGLNSRLWIEQ